MGGRRFRKARSPTSLKAWMDMHSVDDGPGSSIRRVHGHDDLLDEIDGRDLNLRVILDHRVENPSPDPVPMTMRSYVFIPLLERQRGDFGT